MSLADLPDVSDDDFLAYTADTFRRTTQPLSDSLAFQRLTEPLVLSTQQAIDRLTPPPPPEPVRPALPVPDGMGGMGGIGEAPTWGSMGQPSQTDMMAQPLFGQDGGAEPSALLNELGQLPLSGSRGGGATGLTPPPATPAAGGSGGMTPGVWSGVAPDKPNIFSYIGQESQRGAEALRSSGASQTPIIGPIATGGAQLMANLGNTLGGGVEDIRRGNILGGVGAALQGTIGEANPFTLGKQVATEFQVPEQIFPGISPDTPVLGGLNNPRELAGLAGEIAAPATALEGLVGRGISAVGRPALRAVGDVLGPLTDVVGGRLGRAAEAPLGIAGRESPNRRYYHGTFEDFDRASVPAGGGRSYALPGYYASPNPETAARYAGYGIDDITGEQLAEEGGRIRAFDLDPDANLFEARRIIPEEEVRQIVREMNRVEPGVIDDEEYFVRRTMDRQGPRWGPERVAGIGALFTMRTAGNDETLVQALKNFGYHGVRAEEAGEEIISLFDTGIAKAKNVLSGEYGGIANRAFESPFFSPARAGTEVATDLAAGTVGGVAAAASTPAREGEEEPRWDDRLGRFVMGAATAALVPGGLRSQTMRNLLKNEAGELGVIRRGKIDPPEDIGEAAWKGMSRNERRRLNYERGRGEYTGKGSRASRMADYGEEPLQAADQPIVAQDEAYDETYGRLTERGVDDVEADETAFEVGVEQRMAHEDQLSEEAQGLYDEAPNTRPTDDPYAYETTAAEEVRNLVEGVPTQLPGYPRGAQLQQQFVARQTGIPGVAGDEVRATVGGETVAASSPEALVKLIADRTGSPQTGTNVSNILNNAGANQLALLDPDLTPPTLPAATKAAIGREGELSGDLPEVQSYVDRLIKALEPELIAAHGGRGDAALQYAVEKLKDYALDFARSADPSTGITSDVLVAMMRQAEAATATPAWMAYDRWRLAVKNKESPEMIRALEEDWKRIGTIHAIYRRGWEVYSSAAGRALRAAGAGPSGAQPFFRTAGGSGEAEREAVEGAAAEARARLIGTTPPAVKAKERMAAEWRARRQAKRKGEAEDTGSDWDSLYWQRQRQLLIAANPAGQRALTGSGRKVGGALEREGLLWSDLFLRDDPTVPKGTKLTENERMRWMFGMEELGVGDALDELWDRMEAIDPDDVDAVLRFWADAARLGEEHVTNVPAMLPSKKTPGRLVRGLEKVEQREAPWEEGIKEAGNLQSEAPYPWQLYDVAPETMPRKEAIDLATRTMKRRLTLAQEALEKARTDNDAGMIRRYEQAVATAQKDLSDDRGMLARFEREYPPDRPRMPDEYRPGEPLGYYDDPATLVRKAEMLKQLDQIGRGTELTRGALSVATSNMLTSARMVQASVLESAWTMGNRLYTQAVWRGDVKGARQLAQGMWSGATPAWQHFMQALRTGSGPMESMDFLQDVGKKGVPAIRSDSLTGKTGWLAPMHRISRGIQEFFSTIAYYGELNRLAHMEAAKVSQPVRVGQMGEAGLTGASRFSDDPRVYFYSPTAEMREKALQQATLIASGGPHSFVAKMLANLRSYLERGESASDKVAGTVVNVLSPFVYGIDFSIRTGLKTFFGPAWYGAKAAGETVQVLRGVGDAQKLRAYSTAAALTGAMDAFFFSQVLGGNITGKGPSDPSERQALLETTDENGDPVWRPDSMRVPLPNGRKLWINYGSFPAFGLTMGLMANMHDAWVWDRKKETPPNEVMVNMATATMKGIVEGTYFRDFVDLASILTEQQSANVAVERFAGGLLGRAIPGSSLMRQTAQAIDPYRKTPENLLQEVGQNIPGARSFVPNQVSPYTGEDVRMGYSPATLLAPGTVYTGDGQPNPLASEVSGLQRQGLRVAPTGYSATQQGRGATIMERRQTGRATRGAQRDLAEEAGPSALALIDSPQYQAMTPEQKAANLEAVFSASGNRAAYAVRGNLELSPRQRLEREQMAVPKYRGVRGTPEEIAEQNARIGAAKSLLSQLDNYYGPGRGERMLRRIDREAWRDARREEIDPRIRWRREQRVARELGLDPRLARQQGVETELPPAMLGASLYGDGRTPTLQAIPAISRANTRPPGSR